VKKDILFSLLLHILFVLLAIWVVRSQKVKTPEPFVASIVTPEELLEKKQPQAPKLMPEKEPRRIMRLPKNLPPPEKFSAIPSSPAAKKSSPSERPEEKATANKSSSPSGSAHETSPAREEQGISNPAGKKEFGDSFQSAKQPFFGRTTWEKLFDRDIIAKAVPKESDKPGKDAGITFDTKEYKYYGYMQRLREKIEGVWKYPYEAEQKRLNGELYIKFTIKKDGSLGEVELLHTSGYRVLDEAAVRALRDANPYWPLPVDWNEDSLTITGRFVYYFSNTFIR
jgi:protein TonB